MIISWLLASLLTLLYCCEWIIVTLLGDVCYNTPNNNIIGSILSTTIRDILTYYTTCNSINPYDSYINNAMNSYNNIYI